MGLELKILRVIDSMDPSRGGPCQGIRNSIPELYKMAIHNEVVCLDEHNAPYLGKDPFTIKDTDTIYETIENLRNTAFNAFIVTRNNKLVGAITRTNVLKALSDNYGHK